MFLQEWIIKVSINWALKSQKPSFLQFRSAIWKDIVFCSIVFIFKTELKKIFFHFEIMSLIETLNSSFDFVDAIDKATLFKTVIIFMLLMYVWDTYLSYRQVIFIKFYFIGKMSILSSIWLKPTTLKFLRNWLMSQTRKLLTSLAYMQLIRPVTILSMDFTARSKALLYYILMHFHLFGIFALDKCLFFPSHGLTLK